MLNNKNDIVIKREALDLLKKPPKLFSFSKPQNKLSQDYIIYKIYFSASISIIQRLYENG